MPPLISFFIVRNVYFSVTLCGDHSFSAALLQCIAKMICIKRLVTHESIKGQSIDQSWHTNNLTALTGKQAKPHEIAKSICQRKYFCR